MKFEQEINLIHGQTLNNHLHLHENNNYANIRFFKIFEAWLLIARYDIGSWYGAILKKGEGELIFRFFFNN